MRRTAEPFRRRVRRWLDGRPDDDVLRMVFGGMIGLTVVVLGADLMEMSQAERTQTDHPQMLPGEMPASPAVLPSTREGGAPPNAPRPSEELAGAISFDLVEGGRLMAIGTIVPGAAEAFAAEIEKRGDYVRTVVLDSPGGSVADALAMGRLIRERGLATAVAGDGYCASSCPLVFSGGVERRAGEGAGIGVHQVFAVGQAGAGADEGMDRAQRISAECQRYLVEMGVDPQVWVHAMETPRHELFYFTMEELTGLKLATDIGWEATALAR